MISENEVCTRILGVINGPQHPRGIAYIKYPARELQFHTLPNGDLEATLPKYGFEYKHRGSKPKSPPFVDLNYTATKLTQALAPDFTLVSVEDIGTALKITVRRKSPC